MKSKQKILEEKNQSSDRQLDFEQIILIEDEDHTYIQQEEKKIIEFSYQSIQNKTKELRKELVKKSLSINQENSKIVYEKKKKNKSEFDNFIDGICGDKNCENVQKQSLFYDSKDDINLHQYAIYFPVSQNIQRIDILSRIFPAFSECEPDIKYENYDKISEYQWESSYMKQWERVCKQFLPNLDLIQCIDLVLLGTSLKSNPFFYKIIKYTFGIYECYEMALQERMNEVLKIAGSKNKLRDLPITIDQKVPINEYTLVKTYKEFFCNICCIYDCQIHGLNQHKKNYFQQDTSGRQFDKKQLEYLTNFYYSQLKSVTLNPFLGEDEIQWKKKFKEIDWSQEKKCSQNCYKNFNKKSYIKYVNGFNLNQHKIISRLSRSIITLGMQNFSFDPCKIWMMNFKELTCELVFVYLFEFLEIQSEKNQIIKNENQENKNVLKQMPYKKMKIEQGMEYVPCQHSSYKGLIVEESDETCKNCICVKRGFCDQYCLCDPQKCSLRRQGCLCIGDCASKKCDCWAEGIECQPDICLNCYSCNSEGQSNKNKQNKCKNNSITTGKKCKTIISKSRVCPGLGLFALHPIQKNQQIDCYLGEYIDVAENQLREKIDGNECFYSFQLTNQDKLVDGKYYGNKARFINHSSQTPNCTTRCVYALGDWHLSLHALRDIEIGQELLFNYDGDGTLKGMFSWINLKQNKKQKSQVDNNNNLKENELQRNQSDDLSSEDEIQQIINNNVQNEKEVIVDLNI